MFMLGRKLTEQKVWSWFLVWHLLFLTLHVRRISNYKSWIAKTLNVHFTEYACVCYNVWVVNFTRMYPLSYFIRRQGITLITGKNSYSHSWPHVITRQCKVLVFVHTSFTERILHFLFSVNSTAPCTIASIIRSASCLIQLLNASDETGSRFFATQTSLKGCHVEIKSWHKP